MTVKVMEEQIRNELVTLMVDFAKKHQLTADNVLQVTTEAVDYMMKNAVLQDEDSQGISTNPQTSTLTERGKQEKGSVEEGPHTYEQYHNVTFRT